MQEKSFSYDKVRLAKVREMLKNGISPYAELANKGAKDQGGLKKDRADNPLTLDRGQPEAEIARLEAKWRERPTDPEASDPHPTIDDLNLFEAAESKEALDPTILHCSFCKIVILESLRATEGIRLRTIIKDEIVEINGIPELREKKIFIQEKVIACPDCCLHLKPGTTKFPQMKG